MARALMRTPCFPKPSFEIVDLRLLRNIGDVSLNRSLLPINCKTVLRGANGLVIGKLR